MSNINQDNLRIDILLPKNEATYPETISPDGKYHFYKWIGDTLIASGIFNTKSEMVAACRVKTSSEILWWKQQEENQHNYLTNIEDKPLISLDDKERKVIEYLINSTLSLKEINHIEFMLTHNNVKDLHELAEQVLTLRSETKTRVTKTNMIE